uniref:AlNc14C501G11944 protein n=1 Tax=Albugo laibachii Nc14 TaxID=890382 RepID=F0X0J9_9STRA|nr:AlNc14C501G11944 [Albugo laibachii Nc14]|eukprot:CCA27290.1 AlNc14C501G11944 [Albugo laibachii Nc14]
MWWCKCHYQLNTRYLVHDKVASYCATSNFASCDYKASQLDFMKRSSLHLVYVLLRTPDDFNTCSYSSSETKYKSFSEQACPLSTSHESEQFSY